MGFWKTLQKESVFTSFGPYKKHRVLAPSFDFKHPPHFIRWRLSSEYGSRTFADDLFIRSCDFRWRFQASFCKDTTSGSLFLVFPDSLIFKQPFCKDSIFCHLLVCFIFFVFLLLWPHCLPELLLWCLAFVLSHEYQNMYKSEQYFVSMAKKHVFLQKGSSSLDDISLQNVIAHPAEFFFVFFDVQKQHLELTKSLKKTNSMVL